MAREEFFEMFQEDLSDLYIPLLDIKGFSSLSRLELYDVFRNSFSARSYTFLYAIFEQPTIVLRCLRGQPEPQAHNIFLEARITTHASMNQFSIQLSSAAPKINSTLQSEMTIIIESVIQNTFLNDIFIKRHHTKLHSYPLPEIKE